MEVTIRDLIEKPIFCIIGPSGSGKTTILELIGKLQSEYKDFDIDYIVSHTTRDRRQGETYGIDYYFVNDTEFDKLNKIEEVEYSGNRYAITKGEVDNKVDSLDSDALFVIVDQEGYRQLNNLYKNVFSIYIHAPLPVLAYRLFKDRGAINSVKRIVNMFKDKELSIDDPDLFVANCCGITPEIAAMYTLEYTYKETKNLDIFDPPIIAVDFDQTIVDSPYPRVDKLKEDAVASLKALKEDGQRITIWTCRVGKYLEKAKEMLDEKGIEYDAINDNSAMTEEEITFFGCDKQSRKISASKYIDDKAVEFKDNWKDIRKRLID